MGKPNGDQGENDTPEIELNAVVDKDPTELSDEEKTYLQDHADDLTPEQAEKFGVEQTIELPDPQLRFQQKADDKGGNSDDDEELDDEDAKLISKQVDKRLGPIEKQIQDQRDQLDVEQHIQAHPEHAKFKDAILKHVQYTAPDGSRPYANLPISFIANSISSTAAQKIGAAKEREAQRKAAETKGGGSTTRPTDVGKGDWHKASKDDFEAKRASILGHS